MKSGSIAVAVLFACFSVSSFAQITGVVKLDGQAPEPKTIDMSNNPDCMKLHPNPVDDDTVVIDNKNELANVVVAIKPADGQDLSNGTTAPKEPAVLDQQGCMYSPHVIAMRAGQVLNVKNSDDFLHNVHSLSDTNPPINQAMPGVDKDGIKLTDITAAETFMVKCEVHPWMKAWVAVFEHPYYAVTKADGTYSIDTKALKDGDYTLEAWHEKYGTTSQKIKVVGGKVTADFTIKPKATADASKGKAMACCNVSRATLAAKTN